jgi:hypothetical protein
VLVFEFNNPDTAHNPADVTADTPPALFIRTHSHTLFDAKEKPSIEVK